MFRVEKTCNDELFGFPNRNNNVDISISDSIYTELGGFWDYSFSQSFLRLPIYLIQVGCSCVVVKDWGKETQAHDVLKDYFKSKR